MKTFGHEIHKRTFTGDNSNPLTSVYGKGKKWAISYSMENYEHTIYETFKTKKECEIRIKELLK